MTAAKKIYHRYEPDGVAHSILPLVENSRVLEVGFGSGSLLRALEKRNNEVYGVDAGHDIVETAKKQGLGNVQLLDISEEPLPFADDFFDAVYCYEVFEHLANPHRLFYETRRVLKEECRFFFTCPTHYMMGYGPSRHTFVYPGLLEKSNLERFFMQMYFAVEYFKKDTSSGIHHLCYILRNRKRDDLPDLLEVITGDYSIHRLYGHVMDESRIQQEIEKECAFYFEQLESAIEAQNTRLIKVLFRMLITFYGDYPPIRIKLANMLSEHDHATGGHTTDSPAGGRAF